MLSPCVKVCKLDEPRGRCIGCGRTILEIAAWTMFTEEERRLIMERLHQEGFDARSGPGVQEVLGDNAPASAVSPPVIREVQVQQASRRHPPSVRIDGIVYGAPVLALVQALQDIASGNLDAGQCRDLARRVLNHPD